jgi:hypothetical protein
VRAGRGLTEAERNELEPEIEAVRGIILAGNEAVS